MEEHVTEVKREVIITNKNLLFDLIQATIMTSSSAFLITTSRYALGHHCKYVVRTQLHPLSCLRSLMLTTLVVPRGTSK